MTTENNPDTFIVSTFFADMAKIIEDNSSNPFGGAACIVAPGCEPIKILILDPAADPALFFSTVITRIQTLVKEMDAKKLGQQWGMR